jgi:hypothetical protein
MKRSVAASDLLKHVEILRFIIILSFVAIVFSLVFTLLLGISWIIAITAGIGLFLGIFGYLRLLQVLTILKKESDDDKLKKLRLQSVLSISVLAAGCFIAACVCNISLLPLVLFYDIAAHFVAYDIFEIILAKPKITAENPKANKSSIIVVGLFIMNFALVCSLLMGCNLMITITAGISLLLNMLGYLFTGKCLAEKGHRLDNDDNKVAKLCNKLLLLTSIIAAGFFIAACVCNISLLPLVLLCNITTQIVEYGIFRIISSCHKKTDDDLANTTDNQEIKNIHHRRLDM